MIRIATVQAGYFIATGVWPLLDMRSFEAVTGPKQDKWLVKTTGLLITAVGAAIAVAAWRREITPSMVTLSTGTAAALGTIDIVYASKGRIPPVYLGDAVLQGALLGGWAAALDAQRRHR